MSSSASWIWQDHHVHFAEICSSSRSSPWVGPRWHHPSLPSLCLIGPTLVHRHTHCLSRGLWKWSTIQLSLLCSHVPLHPTTYPLEFPGMNQVPLQYVVQSAWDTYQALQVVPSEPFPLGFRWEADIRLLPSPQVQARALVLSSSPGGTLLQPPPLLPMKLLTSVEGRRVPSQPFRLPPLEILKCSGTCFGMSVVCGSRGNFLLISCHFSCPSNTFLVDCTFDAV